jgi:hypothetical protein
MEEKEITMDHSMIIALICLTIYTSLALLGTYVVYHLDKK